MRLGKYSEVDMTVPMIPSLATLRELVIVKIAQEKSEAIKQEFNLASETVKNAIILDKTIKNIPLEPHEQEFKDLVLQENREEEAANSGGFHR